MGEKDLVVVFRGSQFEGNLLKAKLENASIPVMERNELERSLHAGFIAGQPGQITLLVYQEDFDRAENVLSQE